eukprot:tig00020675_g12693.t1
MEGSLSALRRVLEWLSSSTRRRLVVPAAATAKQGCTTISSTDRCSLRLAAPTRGTLRALLHTQRSFGFDARANAVLLVRPAAEMLGALAALEAPPASAPFEFDSWSVRLLSYPPEPQRV